MKTRNAKNFIRRGFPVVFLCSLLGWGACAKNSEIKPASQMDALNIDEEKWIELSEKLEKQENEIQRLRQALEAKRKAARTVKKQDSLPSNIKKRRQMKAKESTLTAQVDHHFNRKLPVEKLVPPSEESESVPLVDPIAQSYQEEATLADSSQESMHAYYRGLELLEEKKYEEAVKSLTQFVSLHPRHVYADRAQFLIAEAAFHSKEYNLSIVATNLLEARYPFSLKLPDALHRRALSLSELQQDEQAKLTLEKLLSRYPNHPLSIEAKEKLSSLSPKKQTLRDLERSEAPPLLPPSEEVSIE